MKIVKEVGKISYFYFEDGLFRETIKITDFLKDTKWEKMLTLKFVNVWKNSPIYELNCKKINV